METIQARVNPNVLTKVSQMFTGTVKDRITEILQGARRAGATRVQVTTGDDGHVTVQDDGQVVEDFSRLLDFAGVDDESESSSARTMGLFCLAPRKVIVRSNGKMMRIAEDSWAGQPVPIVEDPNPQEGTVFEFEDKFWSCDDVMRSAKLTTMEVFHDGQLCKTKPFVSAQAAHYPELGCRIEVCHWDDADDLWSYRHLPDQKENIFLNFHGRVVSFSNWPLGPVLFDTDNLCYMIDFTGEPTSVELMWPARMQPVRNKAFNQLRDAMEREGYLYLQRRGHHRLETRCWMQARSLGIRLQESEPVFEVGLSEPHFTPVLPRVSMPKGFPISRCYLMPENGWALPFPDCTNAHLLAALGTFREPFVPGWVAMEYEEYAWAKTIPKITDVVVKAGERLYESTVWSGTLVLVDSLSIRADTSDHRYWESPVCMADGGNKVIFVTVAAQNRDAADFWRFIGGYKTKNDTFKEDAADFEQALRDFWARAISTRELVRRRVMAELDRIPR